MRSTRTNLALIAVIATALHPKAAWTQTSTAPLLRTIPLIPFKDPYSQAAQRFRDIDDFRFSGEFETTFSYENAKVTLSYNPQQSKPYFTGHLEATGLKPNFAYQIKLAGKPRYGSRGWGDQSDDKANENLGRAARWWNDTTQLNTWDANFRERYKGSSPTRRETIYGYQFIGDFITDAQGKASVDFEGSKAYHITWQDKQNTMWKHVPAGTFTIGSTQAPYYGYGIPVIPHPVKLWYEWQVDRKHDIVLPKGDYNCRLIIAEESFHAHELSAPVGGKWMNVLATEDFINGKPDKDEANDVRFVIR